jgi:hypothetical protein
MSSMGGGLGGAESAALARFSTDAEESGRASIDATMLSGRATSPPGNADGNVVDVVDVVESGSSSWSSLRPGTCLGHAPISGA